MHVSTDVRLYEDADSAGVRVHTPHVVSSRLRCGGGVSTATLHLCTKPKRTRVPVPARLRAPPSLFLLHGSSTVCPGASCGIHTALYYFFVTAGFPVIFSFILLFRIHYVFLAP